MFTTNSTLYEQNVKRHHPLVASTLFYSAAIASGGGVAAGSMVAVLQSVGATGISGTASAAIGKTLVIYLSKSNLCFTFCSPGRVILRQGLS